MPVIAITRLRIRSLRFLPQFLWLTFLSHRQAVRSPGNLRSALLRDKDNVYWTKTAWTDEAAMRAYMLAGAHRRAMPKLLEWCNEAAVVHWTQDSADLPSWQEAWRRMVAHGRRSKVNHPSIAQTQYVIREPAAT